MTSSMIPGFYLFENIFVRRSIILYILFRNLVAESSGVIPLVGVTAQHHRATHQTINEETSRNSFTHMSKE